MILNHVVYHINISPPSHYDNLTVIIYISLYIFILIIINSKINWHGHVI
jgi:hypothetical protein